MKSRDELEKIARGVVAEYQSPPIGASYTLSALEGMIVRELERVQNEALGESKKLLIQANEVLHESGKHSDKDELIRQLRETNNQLRDMILEKNERLSDEELKVFAKELFLRFCPHDAALERKTGNMVYRTPMEVGRIIEFTIRAAEDRLLGKGE